MKIYSLQIGRALAALLVLLFHLSVNFNELLGIKYLNNFFYFGSCGVDFFFILSGFIISYSTDKKSISTSSFITQRVLRIYPIYWVTFIFFFISSLFIGSSHSREIISIIKSLLLLPNHDMLTGVSWTLSYELYFYLLYSFSLIFIDLKKRIFCVSILLFTILFFSNLFTENLFFSDFIVFEFIFGIIIYQIWQLNKLRKFNSYFSIFIGIVFLIINVVFFRFHRVIQYGIPFCFIFYGLLKGDLKNNNFLILLGDSSYVMYLLHLPIIRIYTKVLNYFEITNLLFINITNILLIFTIIYISIIVHRKIELPINKYLKNKLI
ncbi:acyltransferase family protein [Flammeovirga yaeyamensis]|uniref:Acyltransferase family protein n=1 Tax=Flammeovirga yaeyamensis TaxID=367791 RepID=A0AAX1MYE8_9BACT|nr:acyltransferase [Flammeovirga yaeyamensis]MBB3696339.1 peptidoglycan/LPS O-acetylase OafA/YrhL [Flammeovirga yaeyamensis]NMF35018.1 acyltransferase [Flammeovirga yaeyamensis]QWG00156.1 acyltransferase family protein [Flammeovirga yaeyamensis]